LLNHFYLKKFLNLTKKQFKNVEKTKKNKSSTRDGKKLSILASSFIRFLHEVFSVVVAAVVAVVVAKTKYYLTNVSISSFKHNVVTNH
jgi:hypothetical protein